MTGSPLRAACWTPKAAASRGAARPEDVVAMGDRAFLLHYRTDAVGQLIVALGIAAAPICDDMGDGERHSRASSSASPPPAARRALPAGGGRVRPPAAEGRRAGGGARGAGRRVARGSRGLRRVPAPRAADGARRHERPAAHDRPRRPPARGRAHPGAHRARAPPVVDDGDRVIGMVSERECLIS